MKKNIAAETIDALLPQTQCGLCGYGGCMPYAKAMASGDATINLCPPGGVETLSMLAKLLDQDATPYVAAMQQKQKPAMIAYIREAECIGCTKCIQACPVDAIMGSGKLMHTVIAAECTGCELCVEPCPVDCIDLIAINTTPSSPSEKNHRRRRFLEREKRLKGIDEKQTTAKINDQAIFQKQSYIHAALLRAQQKRGKE